MKQGSKNLEGYEASASRSFPGTSVPPTGQSEEIKGPRN